LGIP
jgi:hypothetical protein